MIKVINHSALLLGLEWLFTPNLYRQLKCLNLRGLMLLVCGMVGAHIVRVLALQSCASLCCQVTQATGWGGTPCDIDFRENTCVAPRCLLPSLIGRDCDAAGVLQPTQVCVVTVTKHFTCTLFRASYGSRCTYEGSSDVSETRLWLAGRS